LAVDEWFRGGGVGKTKSPKRFSPLLLLILLIASLGCLLPVREAEVVEVPLVEGLETHWRVKTRDPATGRWIDAHLTTKITYIRETKVFFEYRYPELNSEVRRRVIPSIETSRVYNPWFVTLGDASGTCPFLSLEVLGELLAIGEATFEYEPGVATTFELYERGFYTTTYRGEKVRLRVLKARDVAGREIWVQDSYENPLILHNKAENWRSETVGIDLVLPEEELEEHISPRTTISILAGIIILALIMKHYNR